VGGIGPALMPTGDIQADFVTIREFYADKAGKYPREQGEVRLCDAIRDEPQTLRDNR
jgi:hypothetical protein